jgi:hypothetical protein
MPGSSPAEAAGSAIHRTLHEDIAARAFGEFAALIAEQDFVAGMARLRS